jgi:hypothetical protein
MRIKNGFKFAMLFTLHHTSSHHLRMHSFAKDSCGDLSFVALRSAMQFRASFGAFDTINNGWSFKKKNSSLSLDSALRVSESRWTGMSA